MRSKTLVATVSGATALTATLILMGCGGGGGPLKPPTNQPPPSVSQQFLQLLPPAQQGGNLRGIEFLRKLSLCIRQGGKPAGWRRCDD
ncbi:MAG: hypothetical protein ACP5VE_08495 [Chthonomonadales bacterium]